MTSIVGPIVTDGTTTTEIIWKKDKNGKVVKDANGQPIPDRVYERDYRKEDLDELGHPKKGAKPVQTRTLRFKNGKVIGGTIQDHAKNAHPEYRDRVYEYDHKGNIVTYTDTWEEGRNPPVKMTAHYKYPSGEKIP